MKKMPKILYLSLFLLALGVVAGGLLSFINSVTAPIIEERKFEELKASFVDMGVDLKSTAIETEYVDGVKAAYEATYKKQDVIAFDTINKNTYTEVSVVVVLSKATGEVLTVKVSGTPKITTHGFDGNFTDKGLNLTGKTNVDQIPEKIVSGATVSSVSVRTCVAAAFEQYKLIVGGSN